MTTSWEKSKKLFEAVEANDLVAVERWMKDPDMDINSKNRQGNTPLHVAVEKYNGRMVRLLMLGGADMNIENSSRSSAVDIARAKEYSDIYQLLSIMDSTTWRPGDDPELMLAYNDKEYDDSRGKEMLIQERNQIEQVLQDAGLHHCYAYFERNKISYLQFLRLDDQSLREIGIEDPQEREKIVYIVNERSDRKWQGTKILPNFTHKFITSAETTCVLKNLQSHLERMSSSLSFVRNQQARNPEMLLHNLEAVTMEDLTSAIGRVSWEAENLIEAVSTFAVSTEEEFNDVKESDSRFPFATALVCITAANTFLWGLGTVLYLRYRNR